MNPARLWELLAAYALEHPDRPLSDVGVLEFAKWHDEQHAWDRVIASAKVWEESCE